MHELIGKYQKHLESAFGVECNFFDVLLKEFKNPSSMYCISCRRQCDFKKTHLYGFYESVRWDNKYIYYCPCGYIFIAVPVFADSTMPYAGIITGPVLMENPEDFDGDYDSSIPNFSTSAVNDITELISAIFAPKLKAVAHRESTEDFLNSIYKELEILPETEDYPIELEKELQTTIMERNGKRARSVLNRLLGQIFFRSDGNFKIIKARVLELIVLLSRSAIEGGADIKQIFNLNNSYISEIENFKTLEEMSIWLTEIINRFVSYVFEFRDIKHADTIYKITAYIKSNYMKKITLDSIAEYVYLSRTYVSKIFKDEMKITLSQYINQVRIEKSKLLLADNSLSLASVADLVGYEDQSYFTKTFKNIEGISPGKYREKHAKS